MLYRSKTGNLVTDCSRSTSQMNCAVSRMDLMHSLTYFFWSGKGKRNKAASTWQKTLRRLWPLVKPALVLEDRDGKRIQPKSHMFRNSFAVGLLKNHVSVDHVAMLLADDPDTVKQHYYPWVPELQDLLDKEVKRSWDKDAPIILADVDMALQETTGQA